MLKNQTSSRKAHGCPTGKKRFRDHRDAVSFLHHAKNARCAAEREGVATKLRVVRCYECSLCHGFHVTSMANAA